MNSRRDLILDHLIPGRALRRELTELREANSYIRGQLADLGLSSAYASSQAFNEETATGDRLARIYKSRQFYDVNALYAAALDLVVAFVVGKGLQAPQVDKHDQDADAKNKTLTAFWRANEEYLTGFRQLQGTVMALLTDGQVPVFLFPNVARTQWRVRLGDALLIQDVLTAPDDPAIPLMVMFKDVRYTYDRSGNRVVDYKAGGYQQFRFYYTQFYAPWVEENGADKVATWPLVKPEDADTLVYLITTGTDIRKRFGSPPYWRACTWLTTANGLASDLATFVNTATTFAAKRKLKGATPAQVAAAQARMLATLPQAGGAPQTAAGLLAGQPGRVTVENEKSDWQTVDVKTGGSNVLTQGLDAILNMVYAATGFGAHYFGNPRDANRATAQSMDLPVIKRMEGWQSFWLQVFADMARIVLGEAYNEDPDNRSQIVQDFPPITERELNSQIQALATAYAGDGMDAETFRRLVLTVFGVKDIQEVLDRMAKADAEKPPAPPPSAPGTQPGVTPGEKTPGDDDEPETLTESAGLKPLLAGIRRTIRLLEGRS